MLYMGLVGSSYIDRAGLGGLKSDVLYNWPILVFLEVGGKAASRT